MINQKCPRHLILPDNFDFNWFKNIVFSHHLVIMANISMDNQLTNIMENFIENPIFSIESYQLIRGGSVLNLNSLIKFKFELNAICRYENLFKNNKIMALIMINQFSERWPPIIHLDGNSIFHVITKDNVDYINDLIEMFHLFY